jgi:hypothetical protein
MAVGWAQSGQNLAVGESRRPQLVQARGKGAAHSSQNFASGFVFMLALRALHCRTWLGASDNP